MEHSDEVAGALGEGTVQVSWAGRGVVRPGGRRVGAGGAGRGGVGSGWSRAWGPCKDSALEGFEMWRKMLAVQGWRLGGCSCWDGPEEDRCWWPGLGTRVEVGKCVCVFN